MCEGCIEQGFITRWLAEVLRAFCDVYSDIEYGFGHIVFADWNVDDEAINYCLKRAARSEPYIAETEAMLRWLLTVPAKERGWGGDGNAEV